VVRRSRPGKRQPKRDSKCVKLGRLHAESFEDWQARIVAAAKAADPEIGAHVNPDWAAWLEIAARMPPEFFSGFYAEQRGELPT
jgi:hypothetical protein